MQFAPWAFGELQRQSFALSRNEGDAAHRGGMNAVDLSVAIVSYNVREFLAECLSSVEASGHPLRMEVIVVDNASHDGSAEMVCERFPQVTLIRNSENLGFARATNQALHRSRGRYLLLLNPDSIVVGDSLPRMVDFMGAHPECGAATCRTWLDRDREWSVSNFEMADPWREILLFTRLVGRAVTPRNRLERHWRRRWEVWRAREPCEVECIKGNFFLVSRTVFTQVGGLDERFFLYYEDDDWSRRIRQAGWKLYYHPGVGVVHHISQSSKGIRDLLRVFGVQSQRHYLTKQFGWLRAAAVRFLQALDSYLIRLLQIVGSISENWPGPISPGACLDLRNCPVNLSWPASPGATRYLFEVSMNPLFHQETAARFVTDAKIELPVDELRKPGVARIYWRAVPFCRDQPMAPWVTP
jgi:GT2 family glycosyltransferase